MKNVRVNMEIRSCLSVIEKKGNFGLQNIRDSQAGSETNN